MQEEQKENEQYLASCSSCDERGMMRDILEDNSFHSAASTVATECSSEIEVEQYLHDVAGSPRQFSLADAQIALSYIHRKMKFNPKFERDQQCKVLHALKQYKPSFSTGSASSSKTSSGSISSSSSSKTYSRYHRPERPVHHETKLLKKDSKNTVNIYTSNVDFVERQVSISMIEDTPAAKVIPAEDDIHHHTLRRLLVPSLPPTKPPPLQLHADRKSVV